MFHIKDESLGTTGQCTVQWTDIPEYVPTHTGDIQTPWNVVTGDPVRNAFSREGCNYDGTTPLASPIRAFVNGNESQQIGHPGDIDTPYPYGVVSISRDAPKGSTVRIDFHYSIVDEFPADVHIARVYSSSDRTGEWVAIREVASEHSDAPAAASSMYRGEVAISDDTDSKTLDDGKVYVRQRSRLSVVYYDTLGAATPAARDSESLNLHTPTATPKPVATPIPAGNPVMLIAAVVVGVMVVLLRAKGVGACRGRAGPRRRLGRRRACRSSRMWR